MPGACNALACVPRGPHARVAAAIRRAFGQPDHAQATRTRAAHAACRRRARRPKRGALVDEAEPDVRAPLAVPVQHRIERHSTNPLERLNKEIKRRADVVGIFPYEESIVRLIGAVLPEANDEWQLQHRYRQTRAMAERDAPPIDDPALIATTKAA